MSQRKTVCKGVVAIQGAVSTLSNDELPSNIYTTTNPPDCFPPNRGVQCNSIQTRHDWQPFLIPSARFILSPPRILQQRLALTDQIRPMYERTPTNRTTIPHTKCRSEPPPQPMISLSAGPQSPRFPAFSKHCHTAPPGL